MGRRQRVVAGRRQRVVAGRRLRVVAGRRLRVVPRRRAPEVGVRSGTPRGGPSWAALSAALALASNVSLVGVLWYRRQAHRPPLRPPGDEPPPPAPTPADDDAAELAALPRALKIVGAVVAPTTLLTGLLFYFGRIYANQSFAYFGVNFTALDLTVSDYLIRSADGLIVPLLVVAFLVVVALLLQQLLQSLPTTGWRTTARVIAPVALLAGLVLVGLALVDVMGEPLFATHPETRGVLFTVGVIALAYGVHTVRQLIVERHPERRAKRPVLMAVGEWATLFVLVGVGLFWAAGSYAGAVGTSRAQQIEASLSTFPAVTVFSEKKLSLRAPGVLETPCSTGSAYLFRYEGLTLILQSGNQYLLLPINWKHDSGTAFLLPRGDGLRIEFSPAGQPLHAAC
jgi:hypothetical protein